MATQNAPATLTPAPSKGKKFFTLEEANRSLPYVRKVVADLTACYARVLEIRHDIEHPHIDQTAEELETDYEQAMEKLGQFVDELNLVGVELKDFEKGLLDFPSLHNDREIHLCWQLGEESIVAWHEIDAGYKGRQDVSTLADAGK